MLQKMRLKLMKENQIKISLFLIIILSGCAIPTRDNKLNCSRFMQETTSILAMSSVCDYGKKRFN